jgi:thiol-disulfide isomerase/thioredoxin
MQSLMALKKGDAERPPVEAGLNPNPTNTSKGEQGSSAPADNGFGSVDLSELSDGDKQYLGLSGDVEPILKNINADLVIFEFLSVYCPSCQMQAPIFNQLHSAIEADPMLRSRVKMLGIGVGNNEREVNRFKEEREVAFPVLPDPKFTVYERLVDSMRTPYTVMLRKDKDGNLILVGSHIGLIRSYESYLAEIRVAMQYDEDMLKLKREKKPAGEVAERTELKLSEEELMAKVEEAMIKASGDQDISVAVKPVPLREESKVYQGDSGHVKYFAVVANRESVCDICHAIQFIYVFDEKGTVVGFEPVHLTKYGNKVWSEEDVKKMRERVLGRSVLQPVSFDSEVDAVTSATITSAVIFQAIAAGKGIFRFVTKERWTYLKVDKKGLNGER